MDAGIDFIQPEFLDLLFFQQKNLVIFPYVDLKHLHSLELFTVGHNVIDFESTALNDLKSILEYDSSNSYSQTPSLYLIYNLDKSKVKEILKLEGIKCILNVKENISDLANGENFIFYNKKNKKFINYEPNDSNLEFASHLISKSENETILHDEIQQLKILGTRIFTEINKGNNPEKLKEILSKYEPKYWNKILKFVEHYFKINVPEIEFKNTPDSHSSKPVDTSQSPYSHEYELIINQNKNIAREFIQALHDYRENHVNPSNLELEQLYSPEKLYIYLRERHWNDSIPKDFITGWVQMKNTKHALTQEDLDDFEILFKKLEIPNEYFETLLIFSNPKLKNGSDNIEEISEIPSIKDFQAFKVWILKKINGINELLDKKCKKNNKVYR